MNPSDQSQPAEAQPDTRTADIRRNSQDVAARLAARGIDVSSDEHPDQLIKLLEAVEGFEEAVERQGGDLMVDEPVDGKPVREPDNAAFALPYKRADESVGQYTERIRRAATVARALRD